MMKILHRQAGAATEEKQDRLRTSMEEFQRYQEEMMKKYEEMDESDLGYVLRMYLLKMVTLIPRKSCRTSSGLHLHRLCVFPVRYRIVSVLRI